MENPIKMDDLGGNTHYFWKHPYWEFVLVSCPVSNRQIFRWNFVRPKVAEVEDEAGQIPRPGEAR